jgi:hypothetical protein
VCYRDFIMLQLRFPDLHRVDHIDRAGAITRERLCKLAGTSCAAAAWAQCPVLLRVVDAGQEPWLQADDYGAVAIAVTPLFGDPSHKRDERSVACHTGRCLTLWRATCRGKNWAEVDPERPRRQLGTAARAFVDQLREVCRREGLSIGTLHPADELVVQPLLDDALQALRQARPHGATK